MIKEFYTPTTVADALRIKEEQPDYRFLAGGTEINAKGYPGTPESISGLISLGRLGLSGVKKEEDRLVIYPLITLQQIIERPELSGEPFSMIKQAASNVSNRNVRNMATLGGNIAACKSCSDMIPVLLVMDTFLEIYSSEDLKQEVPLYEYIQKKERPLITKIIVPFRKNFHISICRYTRTSNDLALINVCLGMELEEGICKDARLAIGGVSVTPVRIPETEDFLRGHELKGKLIDYAPEVRKHLESHINPIDDLRGKGWFKKELAGGLVIQALYEAAKKGGISL